MRREAWWEEMRSQVVSQDQSDQRINTGNMSSSHILVTGPHTVGKTSLIHTFITGNFQHVSDEREKYCSSIHLNQPSISTLFQPPQERGSEVGRKVMTVGRQEVEYEVQEVAGEGEELADGVRLADAVLLCYRASDVLSLYEAVTKVDNTRLMTDI